jgi:hypothetical protein
MSAPKEPTAVAAAPVGADRVGRPLTEPEKERLGRLLLEHDYEGARLIARNFARKLTRGRVADAEDLMGRVDVRLFRQGWDPSEVTLVKRLCRLVWSEWTHEIESSIAAREAEERFLAETQGPEGSTVTTHAAHMSRERAAAEARLDRVQAAFEEAGDEVNLLWLKYQREGMDDLQEMADASGRDVKEFYRAADRRKRHLRRLVDVDKKGPKDEETP